MARIVKDPDVRRTEILEVAQRLFFQKGYRQTSVQDIIAEIGIAKGTFYHYFSSKQDLLDGMIDRMIDQRLQSLEPVVADDHLSAPKKFERFFGDLADWKVENKAFFLDLMAMWYNDENAPLRQKAKATSVEKTRPLLAKIIEQGIAEGVFAIDYPADIAEITLQMMHALSDTLVRIILNAGPHDETLANIHRKTIVYHHAIERVLNAPLGSIKLLDLEQLEPWLSGHPETNVAQQGGR